MVKRRSLNDALTPEEEAFLKSKKPAKPKAKNPTPKPKPKKEAIPMSKPAVRTEVAPANSSPAQYSLPGNSSITVRIDSNIATALLRASFEQRLKRRSPSTQRDIIAEALSEWLRELGYLK